MNRKYIDAAMEQTSDDRIAQLEAQVARLTVKLEESLLVLEDIKEIGMAAATTNDQLCSQIMNKLESIEKSVTTGKPVRRTSKTALTPVEETEPAEETEAGTSEAAPAEAAAAVAKKGGQKQKINIWFVDMCAADEEFWKRVLDIAYVAAWLTESKGTLPTDRRKVATKLWSQFKKNDAFTNTVKGWRQETEDTTE